MRRYTRTRGPRRLARAVPPSDGRTRYRVRLARGAAGKALTHLAQIESLRRAVTASGLPCVTDSRRMRPRPKLAFGPAISMGHLSLCEYFDVELKEPREAAAVAASLSESLQDGFSVLGARRIPRYYPSLDASINVVRYRVSGAFPEDAARRLEGLLAREEIVIEKLKEGGKRIERVDARPLIIALVLEEPRRAVLTMRFGPKRTVKPEALLKEWLGPDAGDFEYLREELFSETSRGELLSP